MTNKKLPENATKVEGAELARRGRGEISAAGEHDNLDASIDYGSVCHDVDGYLREHTFKLIEAAAEGTAQMLLRRYPSLLGVRIKLDKPWAPVGLPLASCGVEIERVR